ncbi:hypothetical protein KBZ19_05480 [Synechococcus sp. L2F]|nr:hypothetical protein [Synechococcus sp. L2F]MCP9827934.1 hypothetical protein [Synechococcus sp. L2F]
MASKLTQPQPKHEIKGIQPRLQPIQTPLNSQQIMVAVSTFITWQI